MNLSAYWTDINISARNPQVSYLNRHRMDIEQSATEHQQLVSQSLGLYRKGLSGPDQAVSPGVKSVRQNLYKTCTASELQFNFTYGMMTTLKNANCKCRPLEAVFLLSEKARIRS